MTAWMVFPSCPYLRGQDESTFFKKNSREKDSIDILNYMTENYKALDNS